MSTSQTYIAISIVILAIIALLVFFSNKNKSAKKLSPLAGLALAFVLSAMLFGDNRLIGYSLTGVGIALALIDIYKKPDVK